MRGSLLRAYSKTWQFGANHPFWHGIGEAVLDAIIVGIVPLRGPGR